MSGLGVPAEIGTTAAIPEARQSCRHDPYRHVTDLQQALAPDKMRVAFLLGAGCPTAIRLPQEGGGTRPLIPDIEALTRIVTATVEADENLRDTHQSIVAQLTEPGQPAPNLERTLSQVRALRAVVGRGRVHGLDSAALTALETRICALVQQETDKRLPGSHTPYHQLASWIGAIPRRHAIEIFTTNYDLLMEQALEEQNVPYFDGFSGTFRTFFDPASMELDELPARWARLWKLHGSINWRRSGGRAERARPDTASDQFMIHPSHLKYDEIRQMPYLAMMDRLRAFLSRGQCILVTCGYSFRDAHINSALLQGLAANASAVCYALQYDSRDKYPEAIKCAATAANLNCVTFDGACIGTRDGTWTSEPEVDHEHHGGAVTQHTVEEGGKTIAVGCRCKLGDFAALGTFLAREISAPRTSKGRTDAI